MSEQIEPGEGWRLLGPDEVVNGLVDEHQSLKGEWVKFTSWPKLRVGEKASQYIAVRRRIPAKPEALEIKTERGLVTLQVYEPPVFVLISQMLGQYPEDVRLDTTEQIRQLGEWLISVADWREAQDAGK